MFAFSHKPGRGGATETGLTSLDAGGETNPRRTLALRFLGARPDVRLEGARQGVARVNYFLGNDPSKWLTGLPTYREVVYRELWPGIDLAFQGTRSGIKYEFVLRPGADPRVIRLGYRGADRLAVDASGNLLVGTPDGTLTDARPTSYQDIGGRRVPVETRFVLHGGGSEVGTYGFAIGSDYDPRYPLVIDPSLGYGTFLGGSRNESGNGIAVDALGNAYVAGQTESADFPTTPGAIDPFFSGGSKTHGIVDAFVAKFSPQGNLIWATFLGGSDADGGLALAVDPAGNAYVTGFTFSSDFPTTNGAFSRKISGNSDAFVAKLDPNGSALLYSTFLGGGGRDVGRGVAVDAQGSAHVTGETLSSNFPITPGVAFARSQGRVDAFATKLNASGSALAFSTYLGGGADDVGFGIAVNATGVYVAGQTASSNFPTTAGAFDRTLSGSDDAFVARLNLSGDTLIYSTFLGGTGGEAARALAVDGFGQAHVTGGTTSPDFPTVGALDVFYGGNTDAFVAVLAASGSVPLFSTYLGGAGSDVGRGIALSPAGDIVVTGETSSADFPTTSDAFDLFNNGTDAFLTILGAGGSTLLNSTYLGGSGFDAGHAVALGPSGNPHVTGQTSSTDFPVAGTFDTTFNGLTDVFVAKFKLPTTIAITSQAPPSTVVGEPYTVHWEVTVDPPGSGTPSSGTVTVDDGDGNSCSAPVGDGACTLTSTTAGTKTLTASYAETTDFEGSSATATHVVDRANTTTLITGDAADPSVVGESYTVTWTVTVNKPGAGTPTGTVTVSDGTGAICSDSVAAGGCALTSTTAGAKTLTATYSGDGNFNGSSGTAPHQVNKADTTTVITLHSPDSSVVGESYTVSWAVTPQFAGGAPLTGTVTVSDGSGVTCSGSAAPSGSCSLASLSAGMKTLTASYGGDDNYKSSESAGVPHQVNTRATTTTLSLAPSTVVVDQTATVSVTVTDLELVGTKFDPSGTVLVSSSDAGDVITGTCTLVGTGLGAASCLATVTVTPKSAAVSPHQITASFVATSVHSASSGAQPLTVLRRATATTIGLTPSTWKVGQPTLVTVTVTDAESLGVKSRPAGTVTLGSSAPGDAFVPAPGCTLAPVADSTDRSSCFATITAAVPGFHVLSADFSQSDVHFASSGTLEADVISTPKPQSTDRTLALDNPLSQNCRQVVNIFGTGFLPPTTVPSDLVVALSGAGLTVHEVRYVSSGHIWVEVAVAADATLDSRSVTVTNSDGGTGTSDGPIVDVSDRPCPVVGLGAPKAATSTPPPTPTITSVTPSSGPPGIGVDINGSNFGATAGDNTVKFGTVQLATSLITFASTTKLTVTVPVNLPVGAHLVTVTTSSLTSNGVAFTNTAPKLSFVHPAVVSQGSTLTLDLTGTNFVSGVTVQLSGSGITVNSVTFLDSTHVQAAITVGAGAATGSRDVTVVNPDGGTSSLAGALQVIAPVAAALEVSLVGIPAASFLPAVDAVVVTRSSTGAATAKTVTPHGFPLQAQWVSAIGGTAPPSVTFTLTAVSRHDGTAHNETFEPDKAVTGVAAPDCSFSSTDPNVQQVTVSGSGTYTTTLYSWDWGCTFSATATGTMTLADGVTTQAVSGSLTVDTDGDGILDALDPDPLNPDKNGNGIADGNDRFARDGISNIGKQRGVYLVGPLAGATGPMTSHAALDLSKRHLFWRFRGTGDDPYIVDRPGTCGESVPLTSGPTSAGATTIFVGSTLGFPSSGTAFLGTDQFQYAGVTATSFTGVTGVGASAPTGSPVTLDGSRGPAVPDPTLSATNPCPVSGFRVGPSLVDPFAPWGIEVHNVTASYTATTELVTRSLANPAQVIGDVLELLYDGGSCFSGQACDHPSKTGAYQWDFATLGSCGFGTSSAFGAKCRIYKRSVDGSFAGGFAYNEGSGNALLDTTDPPSADTNDNGILDRRETACPGSVPCGDLYRGGTNSDPAVVFAGTRSFFDRNGDRCLEWPPLDSGSLATPCNPGDASAFPQIAKQTMLWWLAAHEGGHGLGAPHSTVPSDILYQFLTGFTSSGFAEVSANAFHVHNGGIE